MGPDKANNERDSLRGQVRFHRMMNIGLLFLELVTVLLVGFLLMKDQVRIVPPEKTL